MSKSIQTWDPLSLWWWHREIVALEHPQTERAQGQNWISPGNAAKSEDSLPGEISPGEPRGDRRGSHRGSVMSPAGKCCYTLGAVAGNLNNKQRICSWFTNLDLGLSFEELREGFGCPGGFDGVPKGGHLPPRMEGGGQQDKMLQLWQTAL